MRYDSTCVVILVVSGVLLILCCSSATRTGGSFPDMEVELITKSGTDNLQRGYVLDGNGLIHGWEGFERPDTLDQEMGIVSTALMDSMTLLLSEEGLLDSGVTTGGTMLRTLTIRIGEREQTWTWAAGLGGRGVPHEISGIWHLMLDAVRSVDP